MQLSDAAVRLRRMLESPSATDVTDADLYGHLDSAHKEILDKYDFHNSRQRRQFTTESGSDKYQISPLTSVVMKVWDRTNKKKLEKVDANYVAENEHSGAMPGKPLKYARFANYIQLLPEPDGAYVIEMLYEIDPTPLTNSGDSFLTPSAWDRGVLLLARYYYYSDQAGDQAKAIHHMNEYMNWLKDKPLEIREEAEADMDSGVIIPTLSSTVDPREDFDHSM